MLSTRSRLDGRTAGRPDAHADSHAHSPFAHSLVRQARLSGAFPGLKFTVCKKADAIYPIVSAASIAAKVSRDRVIEAMSEGESMGSGYPSDPNTKAWLARTMDGLFGWHDGVRFSWSTADKMLDDTGVRVTWECDDETKENQLLQFGGGKGRKKRCSYFTSRRLTRRAKM